MDTHTHTQRSKSSISDGFNELLHQLLSVTCGCGDESVMLAKLWETFSKTLNVWCLIVLREKRSQTVLFLRILESRKLICALKQSISPPPSPVKDMMPTCMQSTKSLPLKYINHGINLWNPGWCFSNIPIFCKTPLVPSQGHMGSWIPSRKESTLDESHTHSYDTRKHGDIKQTFAHKHLKCLALRQWCSFYRVRLHPSWAGMMLSSRKTAYLNTTKATQI